MKNSNSAKDLAYQEMIYNKLIALDEKMSMLYPYTNVSPELKGGTRVRKHPMPGITMETYAPSTLSVGGNQDDFLSKLSKGSKPKIQRPPMKPLKPVRDNAIITTLNGGNTRIDIVKKIMKEQGLSLPQASKFVKEHGLYEKLDKALQAKGGVNRLKKAYRWKDFAKETANDGLDLVAKAKDPLRGVKQAFGWGEVPEEMSGGVNRLKKAYRWKNFAKETANDGLDLVAKAKDPLRGVKQAFGWGHDGKPKQKREPSQWIMFVKQYAQKHNIKYNQALKEAGPAWKQMKNGL